MNNCIIICLTYCIFVGTAFGVGYTSSGGEGYLSNGFLMPEFSRSCKQNHGSFFNIGNNGGWQCQFGSSQQSSADALVDAASEKGLKVRCHLDGSLIVCMMQDQ